ncbi:C3HC zinc finger-like-domain-containing protein [Gigaspora rosea]|uniref:C3HC zinc finger-like-domain-containing protein n=1 Tax=Gigaspora rosea TaxID=44941 RepID=A0A397UBZ1_9GLOM|nr:C3HC zinc finger-like-domain-containing protein [Gigaspora rosea]
MQQDTIDIISATKRSLSAIYENSLEISRNTVNERDSSGPSTKQIKLAPDQSVGSILPAQKLYRPLNKDDFMSRLATFKELTWAFKPDCLNPVECARHGWTNVGKDWLKCEYCDEQMLVKLGNLELEEHLKKQYQEGLVAVHSATCPWRERQCDISIYKFPILLDQVVKENFQLRAFPLIKLGDKLPIIKAEMTEEFIQTMTSALSLENGNHVDPLVVGSAACLALFGWEYGYFEGLEVLQCKACFRRCALIHYRNIARDKEIQKEQENVEQTSNDKEMGGHIIKDTEESHAAANVDEKAEGLVQNLKDLIFDTETQHHWYCNWVNGDGRSTTNKTSEELAKRHPGWSITLESILKCTNSVTSGDSSVSQKSDNQFNNFRNALSPRPQQS